MSSSVRSRHLWVLLALAALLAGALSAVAAPARALDVPGADTDNGQTGLAGTCVATAGPNYLGLACPGGGDDTGEPKYPPYFLCVGPEKKAKGPLKPEQLKSCEKPPTCWNSDPLTEEEQKATGRISTPGPEGITYYWTRCLRGVAADLADRNAIVTQNPVSRPNSSLDELVKITDKQRDLVNYYFGPQASSRRPPAPVVASSPNDRPRVGTDVSFYDFNQAEGGTSVSVQAGNVRLMAVEDSIRVSPPDGQPLRCQREGTDTPGAAGFKEEADVGYKAAEGETRANTPNGRCWYTFSRSSADQPGNTYQIPVTSHWTVWQQVGGGGWTRFTSLAGNQVEFDKTGNSPSVVTEVQAINVLPEGVSS